MSDTSSDRDAVLLQRIVDGIKRGGWQVIGTATDEGIPFTYTVGLTRCRVPELYLEGIDPRQAQPVLNTLAGAQIEAGAFDPGHVTHAAGHSVRLDQRTNLDRLVLVRRLFGSNEPVPPTALTVTVLA